MAHPVASFMLTRLSGQLALLTQLVEGNSC